MPITIIQKVDSGGFGDVWIAIDSLDRQVAVKIIRSAAAPISTALDHAKALARASHPNVVVVYGIDRINDPETGKEVDCVLMEWIDGPTLSSRLTGPRFTGDEVREIGLGIIAGLEHIHGQGLTHGDLHNDNVMLSRSGVKIIDILYRDTLALLSTQSRDDRIRRDLVSLRLLLQDVLTHSEFDPGEAIEFNNLLRTASGFAAIRAAFEHVTETASSKDESRLLDHAYKRATDENFVEGESYASALADETPREIIEALLKRLVAERTCTPKQSAYVRALWSRLSEKEQKAVLGELNQRIEEDAPGGTWWPNLRFLIALGETGWNGLSPVVRLRLESLIVNDILSGRYDIYRPLSSGAGALGTYARSLWPFFSDRAALLRNIESMLRQSWYTQNYVGNYLMSIAPWIVQTPAEKERMIEALASAVRNDAKIVTSRLASDLPEDWVIEIRSRAK